MVVCDPPGLVLAWSQLGVYQNRHCLIFANMVVVIVTEGCISFVQFKRI